MKIRELNIKNFKSIQDLSIKDPNPFTVFVGPNGAGKSNIFEALEFLTYSIQYRTDTERLFGGMEALTPFNVQENLWSEEITDLYSFNVKLDNHSFEIKNSFGPNTPDFSSASHSKVAFYTGIYDGGSPPEIISEVKEVVDGFSRIFINNRPNKVNYEDDQKLNGNTISNLEKVLKRILSNDNIKEEMIEWLGLFIPELENIDVHHDKISNNYSLSIKEKYTEQPFNKSLMSDGSYNILCLLTAIYQSDKPQFLCIEEPENGLNPFVIKELVSFFRNQCKEKGHYIWLNTHSQTLVSQLLLNEIIIVDKKQGTTQIKQLTDKNIHGLTMDEAWLSNALGGGLPW